MDKNKEIMNEEAGIDANEEEVNAELEAASDSVSAGNGGEENVNEKIPYVVPLTKGYEFDGEIIKEVDLSGLEDLTTLDGQEIDRAMAKLNHYPKDKFRDTLYTKHIAMRASGLPVEFFNSLSLKNMQAITSRVAIYFLY